MSLQYCAAIQSSFQYCISIFTARLLTISLDSVQVTFKTKGGDAKTVDAVVGDHILAVAHKNDIDLEGYGLSYIP